MAAVHSSSRPSPYPLATLFSCSPDSLLSRLQKLSLFGLGIGDVSFGWILRGLPLLSSLRSLDLSWNSLSDTAILALARLIANGESESGRPVLRALQHLSVTSNRIGVAGAAALLEALGSPRRDPEQGFSPLLTLDFSGNSLGPGLEQVSEVINRGAAASLQRLSLSCNDLSDLGACRLASALQSSPARAGRLTRLDLESNLIGNVGVSALAEALASGALVRLMSLDLRNNTIGDPGARDISAALRTGQCPSLGALDLAGNSIGSDGAIALAGAVVCGRCPIRYLSLAWNNLGDSGARGFAETIQAGVQGSCLERLDMGNNSIGDDGVRAIARALDCALPFARLVSVDLTGNDFHDSGIKALARARSTSGESSESSSSPSLLRVDVYNGMTVDQVIKASQAPMGATAGGGPGGMEPDGSGQGKMGLSGGGCSPKFGVWRRLLSSTVNMAMAARGFLGGGAAPTGEAD